MSTLRKLYPWITVVASMAVCLLFVLFVQTSALAAWDGTVASGLEGTGTESDPYLISTAEELAYLSQATNNGSFDTNGKHFKLTENIVLNDNLNGTPVEWTPIGTVDHFFEGIFDGDGHTVKGIYINKPQESGLGMFSIVGPNGGVVRNLGVIDSSITGYYAVGGIASESGGTIEQCYFTGAVNGYELVGGICGQNNGGTINICYNAGTIDGTNLVGGICGNNYNNISPLGTISNCCNVGITHANNAVGGICGRQYGIDVESCYSAAEISSDSGAVIFSGYYLYDLVPAVGREYCKNVLELAEWDPDDFGGIWTAGYIPEENYDGKLIQGTFYFPYLTAFGENFQPTYYTTIYDFSTDSQPNNLNPCTPIYTAEELQNMVSGCYVLMNDIDMSGKTFTPIGDEYIPFLGYFSGNGHTISNLTIESTEDNVGLFGCAMQSYIMDLGIKNAKISGGNNVGGILGRVSDNGPGAIINCYYTGTVNGTGSAVGGICGNAKDLDISNCYNLASVTGNSNVGGICGSTASTNIRDCYSAGTVAGVQITGGICGAKGTGTIGNCYYNSDFYTEADSTVGVSGLTTVDMTAANSLQKMNFSSTYWNTYNSDKENGIAYYPDLKTIEMDLPTIAYQTRLVLTNTETNVLYGDDLNFKIDAQVKFDGTADFVSAIDYCKPNSFTIWEDGSVVVARNDITGSTGLKTAVCDAPLDAGTHTFTLKFNYEYYNSYFSDETAECTVVIGKATPAADDFVFTEPATLVYDGGGKTADVTADSDITGMGAITVKYYDENGTMVDSVVDAGRYTVKIDVAEGDNFAEVTDITSDTWTFEISKATPTAEMFNYSAPSDLAYNGTAKTATAMPATGITGMGDITVKYYQNNTAVTPTNAGTYTVKIDVAEGDNYAAITGLVVGTFEITKGTAEIDAPTATAITYGQLLSSSELTAGWEWADETVIPTVANSGYIAVKLVDDYANIDYTSIGNGFTYDEITHTLKYTAQLMVNKATLTVTAKSYTIKVGDALPNYEYTTKGLVNGDTLEGITVSCPTADNSTAGTYPITVTGMAETDKYTITYVNGELTVSNKSTGGSSGGSSSGGGSYGGGGGSSYVPENPEIDGKSASWTTIASDISKLPDGGEVTIELNGNDDIPSSVIKQIAENDLKATFVISSTKSWIIDGAEIEDPAAVDLSIITIAFPNTNSLRGEVEAKFRIDGTNAPTKLMMTVDKKNVGKFANLYKKVGDNLVFVDNVRVDENGEVVLPVSEKGEYAIMLCEFSDRKGDVSNDGVVTPKDASSILKDVVELEAAANPVMLDYNGDGVVTPRDARDILIDIVFDRI